MFNLKGCEIAMVGALAYVNNIKVGTGTTAKDYTDTGLESEVLSKAVDSIENKLNGDGLIIGSVDYAEAVGYILTENGISTPAGTIIIDSNYALEKTTNEKYIYYFYTQAIPREALL